jgi:uncharacterized protein involved in exopolysaccharide biosynthesis
MTTSPPSSTSDDRLVASPPGGPITIIAVVAALARRKRLHLLGLLTGARVAAIWSFMVRERYAATAIFAPGDQATPQLPGGLAALGSAFGSNLSLGEGTRSLQFYAEVLKGHDLLSAVALDSFPVPDAPGTRQPLSVLMHQGGDTPARVLDNTVTSLQKRAVSTSVNDRTGMISLTVAMPSPELAAAVANRLYSRLEAFNFAMRRSGATSRREFSERELAKARDNLDGTEAAMRDFLERNRGGLDTPRLALQREQLQRRIDVAQIAYRQMTQELVEARIAEARDTPVFTVVQQAAPPMDRTYPQRKRMIALGGIVGGCLAALAIALQANAGRVRELDPESFAALRRALPWRRVRHQGS